MKPEAAWPPAPPPNWASEPLISHGLWHAPIRHWVWFAVILGLGAIAIYWRISRNGGGELRLSREERDLRRRLSENLGADAAWASADALQSLAARISPETPGVNADIARLREIEYLRYGSRPQG